MARHASPNIARRRIEWQTAAHCASRMGDSGASMQLVRRAFRATIFFLLLVYLVSASAQAPIVLIVVDENNIAVSGAEVLIQEPGKPAARLTTDYNGRTSYVPRGAA